MNLITSASEESAEIQSQRRLVQNLQLSVYSQADPAADGEMLTRLNEAQQKLAEMLPKPTSEKEPTGKEKSEQRGRFLGADTTGLDVAVRICMDPVPTGAYHLMDPETEPLVKVDVENVSKSREKRRICVKSFIEGISAQAVRTVEIDYKKREIFKLLPTIFPHRAEAIKEVQRATLHVIVEDLDGKLESHNSYVITLLARTASFNSVRRPDTDEPLDLSHYYGAWVTPYVDAVQERIRAAVTKMDDRRMFGYQGDPEVVPQQVAALYAALQEKKIVYVNSVIDYGAASGHSTQRTRLPRESLDTGSANCIDGTVLMASLIEGISLNPAILLVPGHALVGWETWQGSGEWQFLETTMIGSAEFDVACQSGQRQYDQLREFNQDQMKLHSISELRSRHIWPME